MIVVNSICFILQQFTFLTKCNILWAVYITGYGIYKIIKTKYFSIIKFQGYRLLLLAGT